MQENLSDDVEQLVDVLTEEGAEIAQAAYGDWGVSATPFATGDKGSIIVYGDMPLIAEFGAGDWTMDPSSMFENAPSTPVYPGSYSRLEGTGEYWESSQQGQGFWHFGGQRFTAVPGRHGLYNAKKWLIDNAGHIAREVIQFD
jgi:hypothetical protein